MYDKFLKLINQRQITAYKVSKDIGISPTVFSDWKSGKSSPKIDKLQKIAVYFDVSIEYFLD